MLPALRIVLSLAWGGGVLGVAGPQSIMREVTADGTQLNYKTSLGAAAPQGIMREVTVASRGEIVPSKAELMRAESFQPETKDVRAHGEDTMLEGPFESTGSTSTTKAPVELVSCGGHKAPRCRLCTVIDPNTGLEVEDRGPDWCHGDCTYYDKECHTLTAWNLKVKQNASKQGAATTMIQVPDLLNPEITDKDKKLMDEAADRSVAEAQYEAKMRLAVQKQEEEGGKEKTGQFLYAVIMSGSVMLFCCAIASCIMLWRFTGKNGNA